MCSSSFCKKENSKRDHIFFLNQRIVSRLPVMVPELPPELKESVTVLPIDASRYVYVLGTAHVCTKSSEEARALIKWARPSHVMLELCKGRRSCLDYKPQVVSNGDCFFSS